MSAPYKGGIAFDVSRLRSTSSGISSAISRLNQSISSDVDGGFFKLEFHGLEENLKRFIYQSCRDIREMYRDNFAHRCFIWELNVMEETATQESIWQFFSLFEVIITIGR